jgi:hypothetical protein
MGRIIRMNESKFIKMIKEMLDTTEMALSRQDFNTSDDLSDLRKAINSNRIVSVAFFNMSKNEVSIRAIRKNLDLYVPSDRPKTEKQMNVDANNDLLTIVDVNTHNALIRSGMSRREAARKCWRKFRLNNVLGFLVGGKFKDLREENDIMERFGEEVYGEINPAMERALQNELNQQERELDNTLNQPEDDLQNQN